MWSNSGVSGVSRWMGPGVDMDEVGERSRKFLSLRRPRVPTGGCSVLLLPPLNQLQMLLHPSDYVQARFSETWSSGETGSAWHSLHNCSWTCWDISLETEQMLHLIHDFGCLFTSLVLAPSCAAGTFRRSQSWKHQYAADVCMSLPVPVVCTGARRQRSIYSSSEWVMWRLCQLGRSLGFSAGPPATLIKLCL